MSAAYFSKHVCIASFYCLMVYVLSSSLVGRSSALKLKSTPTLSTMAPSKRQRLASRAGVPKRKIHLDDTMVLHAE